jgi:hypothetical protein
MSSLPPSRRKSQATPIRDRSDTPEWSPSERPSTSINLSERRRERRAKKLAEAVAAMPAAVPRDAPRGIYVSWRWVSGIIVVALLALLGFLMFSDIFRIHGVYVGYTTPTHYLNSSDIFGRSGLANLHIFDIDPAKVEQALEVDPEIASAQVSVAWPNVVQIAITERQPALVWEQSGQRVWVDVSGRVMALRQDLPDLVRVVVEKPSKDVHLSNCDRQGMDTILGVGSCIDRDTVNGVLQFKAMYPNVTEVIYDTIKGLGYREGAGYLLWFGNGIDIPTKMAVFNAIIADLQARDIQPVEINVANPDAPYYTTVAN